MNQMMVFAIIMKLMIPRTAAGVFGESIIVNKPRKKSVALGFKAFVRKPILMAASGEMSAFLVCWPMLSTFSIDDFAKIDFAPM